jgi:hypothetical protein
LNAINHLDSAHKSGDAWVRIASSVQAWVVVHWEDPQRLEPIRIPAHLIPINAPPAEDCTLEAMRTQACANQCMDFKGLLFAQPSINPSMKRMTLSSKITATLSPALHSFGA